MWLVDFLGAEDTPYVRAIGRKWLISAVARAMKPGCKADHMLVLEGPQGILKSSALATLCHDDSWFLEDLRDIHGKDALMQFGGKWLVEIAELQSFRGADIARLKAFISTRTDNYRPPYARLGQDFPRSVILAGTVNEDQYLEDDTGGRRFWYLSAAPSISTASPISATSYGPKPPPPMPPRKPGGSTMPKSSKPPRPSRNNAASPTSMGRRHRRFSRRQNRNHHRRNFYPPRNARTACKAAAPKSPAPNARKWTSAKFSVCSDGNDKSEGSGITAAGESGGKPPMIVAPPRDGTTSPNGGGDSKKPHQNSHWTTWTTWTTYSA